MSDFETLMLDELRREFRRTRPPAKAIHGDYTPGIFRLTDSRSIGYRIFWYHASGLTYPLQFTQQNTQFDLIEILPLT